MVDETESVHAHKESTRDQRGETFTDKEAAALLNKHIAWEQEVLKVRSAYAKKMNKALSGKTVARFFQIENKMDIIIEYELAGEIPLIK